MVTSAMHFRRCLTVVLLFVLTSFFPGVLRADEPAKGPTPYPTNDKDWPGKGPIRKFGWMDDNRKYFWTQRTADQGAIVFAGDSLTGNWKELAKAFEKLKVANRGIGGDTSRGLLFRFSEDVLDLNPKAIVIMIGTNDLTAIGDPADAASNIRQILEMIEKKDAALPVVLCTTPPSAQPNAPVKLDQRLALNSEIRKIAGEHKNVTLCDVYAAMANDDGSPKVENFGPDHLHLAAPGYEVWTSLLNPIFEKVGLTK
jgi:lysophospholipase L1-like esterase